MPWKLILSLILLGIVLTFVWLNIGNSSSIDLGFVEFEDVPIFLSLFSAFFLGVLVALPIAVQSARRKTKAVTEKRLLRRQERQRKVEAKRDKQQKNVAAPAAIEKPESGRSLNGNGSTRPTE